MNAWLDELAALLSRDAAAVLVTVAGVRGSAPRETGAKMLVTATESIGTIGGGQLEYQCCRIAAEQLKRKFAGNVRRIRRRFPLGSNCGQCCGGVVDVIFENVAATDPVFAELVQMHKERRLAVLVTPDDDNGALVLLSAEDVRPGTPRPDLPAQVIAASQRLLDEPGDALTVDGFLIDPVAPTRFTIAVFGAGHVGSATVAVLANLDCRVRWVDSRRSVLPRATPSNITTVESRDPAAEVAALPPGTLYLVMTHSHPLDFEICARVLRRGDAAYCGLIGSLPKRRRFERSMRKLGMTEAELARLSCPIGVAGIASKKPADIAVAVAAELLRTRDAAGAAIQDNDRVQQNTSTNVHAI